MRKDIREMLNHISVKTRKSYADMLRDLGLHIGQDQLLCALSTEDGPTQIQLSEQLHCEPPTIANMVKALENYGLIYRERDKEDGRVNRVYLTEKGKDMIQPIEAIWQKQQNVLMADMSADELDTLRQLLGKMMNNLT